MKIKLDRPHVHLTVQVKDPWTVSNERKVGTNSGCVGKVKSTPNDTTKRKDKTADFTLEKSMQ